MLSYSYYYMHYRKGRDRDNFSVEIPVTMLITMFLLSGSLNTSVSHFLSFYFEKFWRCIAGQYKSQESEENQTLSEINLFDSSIYSVFYSRISAEGFMRKWHNVFSR